MRSTPGYGNMGNQQTELSPDQQAAVVALVTGMQAMSQAMEQLEACGLDMASALKSLPGSEPGRTAYDELPLQIRLLVG